MNTKLEPLVAQEIELEGETLTIISTILVAEKIRKALSLPVAWEQAEEFDRAF